MSLTETSRDLSGTSLRAMAWRFTAWRSFASSSEVIEAPRAKLDTASAMLSPSLSTNLGLALPCRDKQGVFKAGIPPCSSCAFILAHLPPPRSQTNPYVAPGIETGFSRRPCCM